VTIERYVSFPPEQEKARAEAKRHSWMSVGLLIAASMLLAYTLGQSQAMKTAWVSDVLTAIPPVALLVAMRFEQRPPTRRFPYGYSRAISVAFLVTAAVLSVVGFYLLYDSAMKLIMRERPPIGTMELFGWRFWAGWGMIAALTISMVIGMTLGRLKQPVAKTLHSKAVQAEVEMNKAEWMSEGAAILGILLVGFGFWWGDAAAAAFISLEIVRGGWSNVRQVIGDLMDESPTELGGRKLEKLPETMREAAERMDWVARASVRLREHGHMITGDVLVVPHPAATRSAADLVQLSERAAAELAKMDWRLHGLMVMPVSSLDRVVPHPERV
jgi:cation diffusion facilitator family transporter